MVPSVGIEPTTYALSRRHSTAELTRLNVTKVNVQHQHNCENYDRPIFFLLNLVRPLGIEPSSSALQTGAMTTLAQDAWYSR